ncbi:14438_t:CDS:2, partial [Gigaspora rosea]
DFVQNQWTFDLIWTSKTVILAGNKEIKFEEVKEDSNGRIISTVFTYKHRMYQVMNVYAPPCIEERSRFFNNWVPEISDNRINILAGDFNVNIDPTVNRISQAPPHNDATVRKLKDLIEGARRSEIEEARSFKTLQENESFKILGYKINAERQLDKSTWPKAIKKIKEIIKNMKSCNLSFRGRILIAKSLLVSRV